jgi:transglutaminase-like putative cysteine protease
MYLEIDHLLRFEYAAWVRESHMEVRVEPRHTATQTVIDFDLAVGPSARPTRSEDWLGNAMHWFSITDYHRCVEVTARSVVQTGPPPYDPWLVDDAVVPMEPTMQTWDFLQFEGPVVRSDAMEALGAELSLSAAPSFGDMLKHLAQSLHERIEYRQYVTGALSSSDVALRAGAGVCQDFSHIAIGLLRLAGIPARYVNGYLHVEKHDDTPSQSHAWVEAWSAGAGWVAFDPTHACAVGERYVVVAYGRSYADVPPNRGVYRGDAKESLEAHVLTKVVDSPTPRRALTPLTVELPTFREAPDDAASTRRRSDEAAASQQQQQQQQ